ncbi:uncharacterized protein LOC111055285 [Nilaparvata lugens]|uniref:uncharacterized protein LOC111055285 n=1 Tax=Nilaparvata lugens TaxID=108931 RepID=UPI00193E0616|nr:uncharacterized protein LOC111055285 [Nilaparvata lugens]
MIKEDDENEEDSLVNACLMVEDTNELSDSNSNKCELCHQFMPSQDLRSLHYVLNHGCKICSVCSQVSITLNSFKIHVRSNHSQFLCDLCDRPIVFSTHGELLKHRNNIHLLFKCPLCIFEFFSESHVESHLLRFHRICVPKFLSANNYVYEWYDSTETYYCNMCGANKCKVDVFSHFIQHHQISLLPLAQKFMSQNLNIRVIGVDSEIDSQAKHNVTICKGCSGHVSEEVPLSAHNFICLGEVLCKICLQPQSNQFTRNSHINEEHTHYPCALGCSDTIVFDNEEKLHDHCRKVHNVMPCHLCTCFVSCAEGLMKQHLQMCHSYYRSDEISLSDSLFNVHCGNTTIGLICSLCDFDAVIQITSVEDLFKHLNFHSVSLGAVSHFLEKDNLHESLHMRLSALRNIDKYFQKSASDTNGSQQTDNNSCHGSYPEDDNPSSGNTEIIFLSNSESECSRTKNSQVDYSQSDESKIHSVEEPITVIGPSSNHTLSNGFDIKNPNNPVNNVADIVNTPETEKGPICLESVGEDPDTSKTESLARCLENDKTLKLKDEVNTLEYEQEGDEMVSSTGDINSNKKLTNYVNEADMNIELVGNKDPSSDDAEMMADNCDGNDDMKLKMELVGNGNANDNAEMLEDDYDGNDDIELNMELVGTENPNDNAEMLEDYYDGNDDIELNMELVGTENPNDNAEMLEDYYDPDDDVELQKASAVFQKKVRLALLNVKPDVNPRDVECVVTDTSDIEESESEDVGARRTKSKFRSLPGLNRIGQKGFRCEICRGKFKSDEGMRELVKHMRCLHGFSCNFTGAQRNVAFTFNKGKPGQRLRMQPGLVCPICSKGWNSKRLLRKHYATVHGHDLAKDATSGPLSYKCRFCEQTFWEAIECFTHEKEEHPEQKPFKCHICGHAQLRKVMLNRHLKLAHPSENLHTYLSYKCKLCLKLFTSYEMLATHVHQIHPLNRVYPCAHCNRTHQNKRFLVAHMKRDHQFRPFQCRHCGEVKQSKRALSIHQRMKHDSKFKFPCKCRICDKKFDSVALRDVHLKEEHTNSNEYRCEECDKVFSSRSAYYAHKRTHRLSIDAYKCQHCQRKFLRRDAYVEHLRIHTTIRHKCPQCDKQFVQRSNMIRHMRMHSETEQPH